MAVIKIFPNSREDDGFEYADDLATWLMTSLKARNGEYWLKESKWVKDLPEGSIVLFRFGADMIVGEAVVVRTERHQEPIEGKYKASVWFSPSSIRLFVPPLLIAKLQEIVGGPGVKDISRANPYAKFEDWSIYPKLLAAHVKGNNGHFL